MALKLSTLRKIDSPPPSKQVADDDTVLVLVKLAKGVEAPDYLVVRKHFGKEIVSAEVTGRDLARLDQDPAVVSVERSQDMPIIR